MSWVRQLPWGADVEIFARDRWDAGESERLRERLGLELSACLMKGRDNYLCRYRLAEFLREPLFEDLDERRWLDRIAASGSMLPTSASV